MKKFQQYVSGLVILLLIYPMGAFSQASLGTDQYAISSNVLDIYTKERKMGYTTHSPILFDSMRIVAMRIGDISGECLSYIEEMNYYKEIVDAEKFKLSVENLRSVASRNGIINLLYYAYHEECAFLINQSLLFEARELLDHMFKDATKDKSPYGMYVCFLCAGHFFDLRNERKLAMDYYNKAAIILKENDLQQSPSTAYILAAHSAVLGTRFKEAYAYADMGLSDYTTPSIKTSLLDIKAFSAFALGNISEFNKVYAEYVSSVERSSGSLEIDMSPIVWNIIHEVDYNEEDIIFDNNVASLLAKKMAYSYIGQYAQSLELSDSILRFLICNIDKQSDFDLNQRAAEMDNKRLEYEKQRLEYKNGLANRRLLVWILSISFVFVILFLSVMNFRTRNHVKQLKEANAIKEHFVQNMSHEVRTPLNSIIGFSQLLTMPNDIVSSDERLEYIEYIKNNSNMLLMLVDDVLNSSDIESGNYEIKQEYTLLNDICKSSIKSIEYRQPIGVVTNFYSDVSDDYKVYTDAMRVQQILVNLLTNSCKNTDHGFIELKCSITERPGFVVFQVSDSGCGIPPEKSEVIFDRFVKLDEFKQGSGMGLSICRDLANRLNGRVYLDSSYKEGARFVFEMKI